MNLVEYISERIDTQDAIETINEKIEQGEEITEIETEVVNDLDFIAISDEEREIYNEFLDRKYEEIENRVGDGIAVYDVFI